MAVFEGQLGRREPLVVMRTRDRLEQADLGLDRLVALLVLHGGLLGRQVRRCLDRGYTSVMVDGSHLPFAENVRMASHAVTIAESYGAWVEAERSSDLPL